MRNPLNSPTFTYKVHAWAAVIWLFLLVPSWYLWRDEMFWVIFISLYANFVSHWGAWQAVRAELVASRAEQEAQLASAMVANQNRGMQRLEIEQLSRVLEILDHLDDRTSS